MIKILPVLRAASVIIGVTALVGALATLRATPVVAAEPAARPVHRFLHIALSPDGRYVASVEGDSPPGGNTPAVRELVIRSVRDGMQRRIDLPCGAVPQCWPDSPAWSPDGKRVSFALRAPGSHARAVYSVTATGSELTKILDFDGTIEDLKYGADGRLALLATAGANKEVGATEAGAPLVGDLDEATPEQRIALVEHGALRWVSPPELFVYEFDWRPPGQGFVGTASPGDGDAHWWTAKLYAFSEDSGPPRVLYTPADSQQQLAAPTVSPDGRTVAFIAGLMSDFGSTGGDAYVLQLDRTDVANLTPAVQATTTALNWSCEGHLIATWLARDATRFVDLGSGRAPATPRELGSSVDTVNAQGAGRSACPSGAVAAVHESFTRPPEIEVATKWRWRAVTQANAALHLSADVRSIHWHSDGYAVQGWLLLPEHATRPMPLVTFVHGGPAAAATPSYSGPGLVSALLERGYAVFRPNPRGSYGAGERFTRANVRDFGHGDLRDILAGVDAAATVAPIDLSRLGITGSSYGGFMTMWAVTQTHRFKAAVASAGVSNWLSYYGESGIDGWMLPYFGASVYDDAAVYANSSAINFIRNVQTPTFAYVGELDIECPASQTQEFWHALKALNVPTSIMIYPGEGHRLRDPEHAADATRRTVAWLDRYLK